MKFEPLRRAWARYFRPRATSVSPQEGHDRIFQQLCDLHMREGRAPPKMGSAAFDQVVEAGRAARESKMIAPPPDPAVDQDWRWSEWLRERDTFSLPGWTYCRFPIQFPGDRAVFVFGMARENFGVYHTPIKVHNTDDHSDTEQVLACMVHMKTGCGMGMFVHRHVAAQACELAEKVESRWAYIDPDQPDTWREAVHRVNAAWRGVGIVPAQNVFAHRDDGNTWNVYGVTVETTMRGRPEQLS